MAEVYESTLSKIEAYAKRTGLELRIVGINELFVDIDNTLDLGPFFTRLIDVNRLFIHVNHVFKRLSKNGNGWHMRVVMAVAALDIRERCALHLAVNSDPVRELLRLRSIRNSTEDQHSIFLDDPKKPEVDMTHHWLALVAEDRQKRLTV